MVTSADNLNEKPPAVYTNNVPVFLHYWLTDRIPIHVVPSNAPGEPYGACFGIMDVVPGSTPYYDQRPLKPEVESTVVNLKLELME